MISPDVATSARPGLPGRLLDSRFSWPLCGLAAVVLVYGSLDPRFAPPGAYALDKLVHLVVYTGLAVLGCLPCERARRRLAIALALIALGGSIEIAQSFVPGRYGTVSDFIANGCGVGLGVALSGMLRPALAARRKLLGP
jgi:VanZ family protein